MSLSVALTGYDSASLQGTGMVHSYLTTLTSIVGESIVGRLLNTWTRVAAGANGDADELNTLLVAKILGDATLGPVARNVTTMWYLGQWVQLPADWRNAHGATALDTTQVLSAEAYVEGLVWDAIGSHPQGAKQPGYASWALPPRNGRPHD
jgi:hypothetical protein